MAKQGTFPTYLVGGFLAMAALFAAFTFYSESLVEGDIGLYCPYPEAQTNAPETVQTTENILAEPTGDIVLTTRVPAILGLSFGVQLKARAGLTIENAKLRITHPPMGHNERIEQGWTVSFNDKDWTMGLYRFETPEEMIIGRWTFEVLDQSGALLFQQHFDVLPATPGETLEDICGKPKA